MPLHGVGLVLLLRSMVGKTLVVPFFTVLTFVIVIVTTLCSSAKGRMIASAFAILVALPLIRPAKDVAARPTRIAANVASWPCFVAIWVLSGRPSSAVALLSACAATMWRAARAAPSTCPSVSALGFHSVLAAPSVVAVSLLLPAPPWTRFYVTSPSLW